MASTYEGIQLLGGSHTPPSNDVRFYSVTWKDGISEGPTDNHSLCVVWQKSVRVDVWDVKCYAWRYEWWGRDVFDGQTLEKTKDTPSNLREPQILGSGTSRLAQKHRN